MAEVNGIFSEFNMNIQDSQDRNEYIPKDNKFERSPSADKFTSSKSTESDKNKVIQIGTIAATAVVAALAYATGKRSGADALSAAVAKNQQHEKTIQSLQQTIQQSVEKASAQVNAEKTALSLQEKQVRELVEAIEPQIQQGGNAQRIHSVLVQQITASIQNPKLSYDPMAVPVEQISDFIPHNTKIFRLREIPALVPTVAEKSSEIIQSSTLKAKFAQTGTLDIILPTTEKIHPVRSTQAFIGDKAITGLNETVDTQITTDYGKRINWSARKIARDIMQNFYDGHGNTLDGVRVTLTKQPNGSVKVKISGQGLYDYRSLQLLGSGNKVESGYNAGGFGEGSKILAANLLGKGETSAVTYSCADWQYTLSAPKNGSNIIQQTLRKSQQPLNGNTIEFETRNQELVDSIVDSVNFFNHSQNPDFQGLTFDSESFAFRILGGDKKGNIYLTQRFEFEGDGKWEGAVDTMDIIFKRKPDPDKFFEITGKKLPQDRDRTSLSFEDIQNLTHYFAHDMKDEELIQSILSTKSMWGTPALKNNKNAQSSLSSFLQGLLEEAKSRNLALDLQGEKFVVLNQSANDTVIQTLSSYGYKFLPETFENFGIEKATTAFRKLSVHTPLEPTTTEIQKLKLLEQGLGIIQENIQGALKTQLQKVNIEINPKYCKKEIFLNSLIRELSERTHDFDYLLDGQRINMQKVENMSETEFAELCKKLSKAVNDLFGSLSEKPDSKVIEVICDDLLYLGDNSTSAKTKDYLISLKDLNLITAADVTKPRYIFDRHSEIAQNTLGEAIINNSEYNGHWVDREYLNTADFYQILGTWIHECCHKTGGDGSADFTYALTDMLRVLLRSNSSSVNTAKLNALAEVFNKLGT